MKYPLALTLLLLLLLLLPSCARSGEAEESGEAGTGTETVLPYRDESEPPVTEPAAGTEPTETETSPAEPAETEIAPVETTAPETDPSEAVVRTVVGTIPNTGILYQNGGERGDILVAIDPGHQAKAMKDTEPVAPHSEEKKAKVSSGTQGVKTGIPEYELTLAVSLLLRDELLSRGYSVLMVRETNDVQISNAERAILAGENGADMFLRVHANGSDDPTVKGALTMCQTKKNPDCGALYPESRRLCEAVLDSFCASTGLKKRSILETDTMTGINWCTVPSAILEMGFMSCPEEDGKMAEDAFRTAAAKGTADGIDAFFASAR